MEKKEYVKPEMKVVELNKAPQVLCGSNTYWNDCNADWGWGSYQHDGQSEE